MKIQSHQTPRYVVDRLRQELRERRYPEEPWLTPKSVALLGDLLRPTDRGVEFGSGRSTIWLASRMGFLTSLEHDPEWHARVSTQLAARRLLHKVDYRLVADSSADHVSAVNEFVTGSLDFALVDGRYRDQVGLALTDKMRPGGLLVVDNVERYLPNQSTRSPAARRDADGFESEEWAHFSEKVASWRSVWTSNGVSDTCIWICS